MQLVSPSSKLVDQSGGSMMFSVPIQKTDEIGPLFKLIDISDQIDWAEEEESTHLGFRQNHELIEELKMLISDCGISHSTLEEVFLKVTR
mmetsp:Transcript_6217/g.10566  ORF Transcript_6217/g.10566 Transcript_6217/m.10566 type:complete len:90 (-) Transcript_6217:48-317(-)